MPTSVIQPANADPSRQSAQPATAKKPTFTTSSPTWSSHSPSRDRMYLSREISPSQPSRIDCACSSSAPGTSQAVPPSATTPIAAMPKTRAISVI